MAWTRNKTRIGEILTALEEMYQTSAEANNKPP